MEIEEKEMEEHVSNEEGLTRETYRPTDKRFGKTDEIRPTNKQTDAKVDADAVSYQDRVT